MPRTRILDILIINYLAIIAYGFAYGFFDNSPMTSIDDFDLLTLRVTKEDAPSVSDTSYHAYVINFENGSGFAIIRADKHSEGVIAVSDDGSFDLNGNDDFLLQLIVNGITSDLSAETAVTKSGVNQVEPLLNAKWTQETSASGCWFNKYCYMTVPGSNNNNVPCGCTVLAGALVIAYNAYPTTFKINNRIIDWGSILSDPVPVSADAREDVALLIGQLFNDCNGKIAFSEGTMVTARQIQLRMEDYGYKNTGRLQGSSFTNSMKNKTIEMLEDNRPVFISALGTSNHEGSGIYGHSWVIDGYKYDSNGKMLVHCNWGWSGKGNGYFATNCFQSRNGVEYDDVTDMNNPTRIPLQNLSYHYRLVYYSLGTGAKYVEKTFN